MGILTFFWFYIFLFTLNDIFTPQTPFKKLTRPRAKQEFSSLRDKWYRSWWIDPGFVQGLSVTRLCTQWIDPQIQQIDRHPTEKWLRQKTDDKTQETHQLALKNWNFDSPKLRYNRMTYLSFNQGVKIDSYWIRILSRA